MSNNFNSIWQSAIERRLSQRLQTAERRLEATKTDISDSSANLGYVLSCVIERLTEKGLFTAPEAQALIAILQIPDPAEPPPAEALREMTADEDAGADSPESRRDSEADALARMSESPDTPQSDEEDDQQA